MDLVEAVEVARERVKGRRALPPPTRRREIREAAGLTQAEVAAVLGVSVGSVSKYETGRRGPRLAVAVRYGELLRRLSGVGIQ